MPNVNQLIAQALKAGFNSYGNFRTDDDEIQCETLTCIDGQFSGEVLEINYNYSSGEVVKVNHFSQFPVNHPHYSPVKFSFVS